MDDREFIKEYLATHQLAVLSTVNPDGTPESAVMGFGNTEQLELIFGTYCTSRKYHNLQSNPHVSFAIGWNDSTTLQYEGVATEVFGQEADMLKETYYAKSPSARKYDDHPEERYFKVTPTWIRYTDLDPEPWKIIELRF